MLANTMFYVSIKTFKAMLTFRRVETLSVACGIGRTVRESKLSAASKAFTYSPSGSIESQRCFSHAVTLMDNFQHFAVILWPLSVFVVKEDSRSARRFYSICRHTSTVRTLSIT